MNEIITWFYCLNLQTVNRIMLAATLAAAILFALFGRRKGFTVFLLLLLGAWFTAVIGATVLRDSAAMPSRRFGGLFASYESVLEGGNPELLRSNYMNILLFYPAGVLVQGLCYPLETKKKLLLGLGMLSVSIEIIQFILKLGFAECDDIFHNGLGLLLGFFVTGALVWILRSLFYRRKNSGETAG